MPLLPAASYRAKWLQRFRHIQTIWPATYRKTPDNNWERERLELLDGDFLDLDWVHPTTPSRKLLIALHGLEGHARRPYIAHTFNLFSSRGWHGVGINYRGCSDEPNRLLRGYHSGETADIRTVIEHIRAMGAYDKIVIVGFSVGGNLALKLTGEYGQSAPKELLAVAAFSTPMNMGTTAQNMSLGFARVYMRSFMNTLKEKAAEKAIRFPGTFDAERVAATTTFEEYDDAFTAPIHGFASAQDYWDKSSCGPFLEAITVPTLLVNASDDPLLDASAFPTELAKQHQYLHLEIAKHGGHLGFMGSDEQGNYWMEHRLWQWVSECENEVRP